MIARQRFACSYAIVRVDPDRSRPRDVDVPPVAHRAAVADRVREGRHRGDGCALHAPSIPRGGIAPGDRRLGRSAWLPRESRAPTALSQLAGRGDVVLPWASVTKLLTGLAILVALEEGTVDLDEPAGPPGATLRHLLSHASGLPLDGDRADRRSLGGAASTRTRASSSPPPARGARGDVVHRLLRPGCRRAARPRRTARRLTGARLRRTARRPPRARPRAPPADARRARDARRGDGRPVSGSGRRPAGSRSDGAERLGSRRSSCATAKSPHWTGSRNSGAHLRSLRPRAGRSSGSIPTWASRVASSPTGEFGDWAKEAWPVFSDAVLAEL